MLLPLLSFPSFFVVTHSSLPKTSSWNHLSHSCYPRILIFIFSLLFFLFAFLFLCPFSLTARILGFYFLFSFLSPPLSLFSPLSQLRENLLREFLQSCWSSSRLLLKPISYIKKLSSSYTPLAFFM